MEEVETFRWGSKLGISVICFLLYGGIFALGGTLGPFIIPSTMAKDTRFLFLGDKADVIRFGEPPSEIMERTPILKQYRDTIFTCFGAFFGAIGFLILGVTWFGLREREAWALWVLAVATVAMLPSHFMVLVPYFRLDQPMLGPVILSLPPYWTFPFIVGLPGFVLGWLALK